MYNFVLCLALACEIFLSKRTHWWKCIILIFTIITTFSTTGYLFLLATVILYLANIIFTKEGKGAGYARNTGIKYVKGKWLLFSDADDYFSENVNRLFDDYENSVMDVIYIPYKTIDLITGEDLEDGLCVTNLEEDLYKKRSDTLRYSCLLYTSPSPRDCS